MRSRSYRRSGYTLSTIATSSSPAPSFLRYAAAAWYSGEFVAGDRALEAWELDDDKALELLRPLEDLELAAARQERAAEFPDDRRRQIGVFLYCSGSLTFERATQ